MPGIDNMGKVNVNYGVCGFASSLYALYTHSPGSQVYLASAADKKLRVAAEIKTFLEILRAEDSKLRAEIETFTRSFGGSYSGFTIAEYIKSINSMTKSDALASSVDISIALPPNAVVKYLRDICNLRSAKVVSSSTGRHEAIIGVADGDPKFTLYNGLCHYVYKRGKTIYSWGNQYTSLTDADASFTECVVISTSG